MYEYKVVEAKNSKKAEEIMNTFTRDGWRVVSNIYWMHVKAMLIITFERELK